MRAERLEDTRATIVHAPAPASPRRRRPMRIAIYALLATGDLAGLGLILTLVGLGVAALATPGAHDVRWALRPAQTIVPLFFAIVVQRKPYSARFLLDARRTARDAMGALSVAGLLAMVIALGGEASLAKVGPIVAAGTLLGWGWLHLWRKVIERLVHQLFAGQPIATVAIVDDIAVDLPPGIPTLFAGIAGLRPDRNDPAALDALARAIAGMERVIVISSPARRPAWLDVLKGANVQGEFLLPELDSIGMLRTARIGFATTAIVSVGPLDTANRILKRALDLSVALGALALLWPVLLVAAVAIRIDSPGPILFRQPRVGRGNRLFDVLKFRSMYVDMCDARGDTSTGRADPRITRVGAFIRKTSIDELPQILNVIGGTMSIVGPRPHAVASKADDRLFWEVDERYWHRHAIKPGITGLAQVKGWRGATETADDLTNRVALDTAYMRGWTVWRDIGIILRTAMVLFHKNAY